MGIFKPTYTNQNGEKCKCRKWYLDFYDHLGRRHKLAGFESRKLSEALHRKIEDLTASKIAGQKPDAELQCWLNSLPYKFSKKFISWGIIDARRVSGTKTILSHLDDYKAVMTAKRRSSTHISGTINRCKTIIDYCDFKHIADINYSKTECFLGHLRQIPLSEGTVNHYITAFKMFMSFMVKDKRISENPLEGVGKKEHEEAKRGILLPGQFQSLIMTTIAKNIIRCRNTGEERGFLYLLAGVTGLRRKELIPLIWNNMKLDEGIPHVILSGQNTKNSKTATQPLPIPIAEKLRQWKACRNCSGVEKVFTNFTLNCRPSDWIREDLTEAEIPLFDRDGNEILFHSLRNSYITFLANKDIPVKVVQHLARHSKPELTFNVYARALDSTQQQAVASLPTINFSDAFTQRLTSGNNYLDCYLDKSGRKNRNQPDKTRFLEGNTEELKPALKGPKNEFLDEKDGKNEMGRGGFEPPTHGFSVRCSTN